MRTYHLTGEAPTHHICFVLPCPLPHAQSDPGFPELPEEVLNATVARYEDLHATTSPPWPHCFEDELTLLVQGCLQVGGVCR